MTEFLPPIPLRTRQGDVRRVGVELEFSGMPLPQAAEAVREAFGGELRREHEYRYTLTGAEFGDFDVTFDSSLLREKSYEEALDALGVPTSDGVKGFVEGVLRTVGGAFLPLEIGTPPIPADRLGEVAKMEAALRRRRAEGARASLLYAFALHFNVEAFDATDPACLLATLRAFLLLADWLAREGQIDVTRRLSPYIDSFPREYARLVIDPAYSPDMATLIDDYVRYNPTRNRPLDLLPVFAANDPGLKQRPELEGVKVKPRPAYHYRLPNSMIDESNWSIAKEWRRWLMSERLANNAERRGGLSRAYLDWDGGVLDYLSDGWVRYLEEEWVPRLAPAEEGVAVAS